MILFLHSALFVALSSFNPACVIPLLHASFHLRSGHHLLFPGMSTSSILLTVCSSFILLTWPCHFSRFFCDFLGRLHHSCPSNVFTSDVIPPCHITDIITNRRIEFSFSGLMLLSVLVFLHVFLYLTSLHLSFGLPVFFVFNIAPPQFWSSCLFVFNIAPPQLWSSCLFVFNIAPPQFWSSCLFVFNIAPPQLCSSCLFVINIAPPQFWSSCRFVFNIAPPQLCSSYLFVINIAPPQLCSSCLFVFHIAPPQLCSSCLFVFNIAPPQLCSSCLFCI